MPQWLPSNFSSLGSVFRNSETGSCFSWLLKFSLIWQSTPVTASKSYRKKANEQITSCLFLGCCSHLCGISNGFYTSFSILLTMEYKAFLLPPPPLKKAIKQKLFFHGKCLPVSYELMSDILLTKGANAKTLMWWTHVSRKRPARLLSENFNEINTPYGHSAGQSFCFIGAQTVPGHEWNVEVLLWVW